MNDNKPKQQNKAVSRDGTTTVEFAITSVVLFVLVMGMLELSRAAYALNTMRAAAMVGSRVASLPGATPSMVQDEIAKVLSPTGISGVQSSIDYSEDEPSVWTARVQLEISFSRVSLLPVPVFIGNKKLSATCSMACERL